MCACDFTSSPGVCDTTLLNERDSSSKKNDMERVEEQKRGSFLERRKERKSDDKSNELSLKLRLLNRLERLRLLTLFERYQKFGPAIGTGTRS